MVDEGNLPLSRRQLGRIGTRVFSLTSAAASPFSHETIWGYGRDGHELVWKWPHIKLKMVMRRWRHGLKEAIRLDHANCWRGIICPADPRFGHFCASSQPPRAWLDSNIRILAPRCDSRIRVQSYDTNSNRTVTLSVFDNMNCICKCTCTERFDGPSNKHRSTLLSTTRSGPDAREVVAVRTPVSPCQIRLPPRVFLQVPVRSVGCNAAFSPSACDSTKISPRA